MDTAAARWLFVCCSPWLGPDFLRRTRRLLAVSALLWDFMLHLQTHERRHDKHGPLRAPWPRWLLQRPWHQPHTEQSPAVTDILTGSIKLSVTTYALVLFTLRAIRIHRTALNEVRFTMFCLRFVLSISCCLVNTALRSSGWYVSPWVLCLWPSVCKSMLNCKHRGLLSVRLDGFSSCFQSPCVYFWIVQRWIWTEM